MLPAYAELHCRSNFSFLTGASHPEELVQRAHALGYSALAITDECSLSGVVRAYEEAQRLAMPLIIGAEFQLSLPAAAPPPGVAASGVAGVPHARLVALKAGGRTLEVGRFIRPDLRPVLARELKWALRGA